MVVDGTEDAVQVDRLRLSFRLEAQLPVTCDCYATSREVNNIEFRCDVKRDSARSGWYKSGDAEVCDELKTSV